MNSDLEVAFPRRWRWGLFVTMGLLAAFLLFSFMETVPANSQTYGSMHMMKRRMLRYAAANGSLPTSVDQLPVIPGFSNRVVDGWGRPIQWHINGDDVTFTSLGRDGKPGGTGEDADMIATFRSKGEDGKWADEFCEWLIDPYGRSSMK